MKILSTSKNRNGTLKFISAIEGINYPFYAVQFHPEKSSYDFNPNHPTVHSLDSIKIMQTFAVFFVNEARKNGHYFENNNQISQMSIYNGEIKFDKNLGPIYLFP